MVVKDVLLIKVLLFTRLGYAFNVFPGPPFSEDSEHLSALTLPAHCAMGYRGGRVKLLGRKKM